MSRYRARLKEILVATSIKRGSFILSSGKCSDYYLDARRTTFDPEGAYCAARVILEWLQTFSPLPKAIGGPTLGADPIVAGVAALSYHYGSPISGFLVRKESKTHGMQQFIEGWQGKTGDPVVIIDDVCTTGDSTLRAVAAAKMVGYCVVAAACLVDRDQGGRAAVEKECPFYSFFAAADLLTNQDAASLEN